MAFTGLSLAQDVWYSGYYTNSSGTKLSAVYKNNTLLYDNSKQFEYDGHDAVATSVVCYGSNVFWAENFTNPSTGYYEWANVKKNLSNWMAGVTTNVRQKINDLYCDGISVTAVGCRIVNGVQRAMLWHESCNSTWMEFDPLYTMGNSSYDSEAFACIGLNGHLYVVGIQYTSEGNYSYRGVLWKDGVELYNLGADYKPVSIALCKGQNNSLLYISGTFYDGSPNHMEVMYYDPESSWSPSQSWYNTEESYGYGI